MFHGPNMQNREVEFVRSLRKAGLSSSLCESINDIRKAVFESEEEEPSSKKYELTDETRKEVDDDGRTHILHRIKAIVPFGEPDTDAYVAAGDLGGWIESEDNLSQEGNCWVYDDAMVYGNASVRGDANVYGESELRDNAQVYDTANVDRTKVSGDAKIYGNAWVYGFDDAINVQVVRRKGEGPENDEYDDGLNNDHEPDYHTPVICDNAEVYGDTEVSGRCKISGNVKLHGDFMVPEQDISGDVELTSDEDLDRYNLTH